MSSKELLIEKHLLDAHTIAADMFKNKEIRVLINSTIASVLVGASTLLIFEELLKLGFSNTHSASISTVLISLLAVPFLRLSFESSVNVFYAYVKYIIFSALYTFIVNETYPFVEQLIKVDYYSFNPFVPLLIVKILFYPLYYLFARFYIFK